MGIPPFKQITGAAGELADELTANNLLGRQIKNIPYVSITNRFFLWFSDLWKYSQAVKEKTCKKKKLHREKGRVASTLHCGFYPSPFFWSFVLIKQEWEEGEKEEKKYQRIQRRLRDFFVSFGGKGLCVSAHRPPGSKRRSQANRLQGPCAASITSPLH